MAVIANTLLHPTPTPRPPGLTGFSYNRKSSSSKRVVGFPALSALPWLLAVSLSYVLLWIVFVLHRVSAKHQRVCRMFSSLSRSLKPLSWSKATHTVWRTPPSPLSRVAAWRSLASFIQPDNIVKSPFGDISMPTYKTLPEYLFNSPGCRDYIAIEDGLTKQQYEFNKLQENSARFGAGIVEHLGVVKGDVVTILCPNRPDYAVAFLGIMMAGGIVSTANTIYTSHELHKQCLTAGTQYIVTTAELFSTVVEKAIENTGIKGVILLDTEGSRPTSDSHGIKVVPFSLLLQSSAGALPSFPVDSEKDVAVIPFSSGTTGLPKGVMLSHHNLIANVAQMSAHEDLLHLRDSHESVLCVMPFYHIYGMIILLANALVQVSLRNSL